MTLTETIKKAIAGGWSYKKNQNTFINFESDVVQNYEKIFLDPLFWSALGKAMGWNDYYHVDGLHVSRVEWRYRWHRFIDTLASGKSIEDFFKEL